MKLLADANVETELVRWLRSEGHDVVWAVDLAPSTPDADLLALANEDERVLLTYDRDFGELVFRRGLVSQGVVLLRFQARLQMERLALLKAQWPAIERGAVGHFVVVSDRRCRIRPLP